MLFQLLTRFENLDLEIRIKISISVPTVYINCKCSYSIIVSYIVDTSTRSLTTAAQSVTTSQIISTTPDRYTSSLVVDTQYFVNGIPPDPSALERVVPSSTVKDNPTGTSVFAFSAISTGPSIVPSIVYPVTIASPTSILSSSTEAISYAVCSSNQSFQETDTTTGVSASDSTGNEVSCQRIPIHHISVQELQDLYQGLKFQQL